MYQKELTHLIVFGVVFYTASTLMKSSIDKTSPMIGKQLMKIPKIGMMGLMALPEQAVLYKYEPNLPIFKKLLVSVAMYVIHFAWNGMEMKPKKSYNELAWILGTSYYAYLSIGVKKETAVALIAADSVMTLGLRSFA